MIISNMKNGKGFTLIEMLVVIAIISIVAAMVMPAVQKARGRAMNAKTESMIHQIEIAMAMYETDFGVYPYDNETPSDIITSERLYDYLTRRWNVNGRDYGPYMELKAQNTCDDDSDGIDYEIADAWGKPIYYDLNDNTTPNPDEPYNNQYSYDLYSKGPDGSTGTGANAGDEADDLNNWD